MQILKVKAIKKRPRLDDKPAGWSVSVWWDDGTCKYRLSGVTWLPPTEELFAPGLHTPGGWTPIFRAGDYFWRALRGELRKTLIHRHHGPNPTPPAVKRKRCSNCGKTTTVRKSHRRLTPDSKLLCRGCWWHQQTKEEKTNVVHEGMGNSKAER